jgi:hypothetical protein
MVGTTLLFALSAQVDYIYLIMLAQNATKLLQIALNAQMTETIMQTALHVIVDTF